MATFPSYVKLGWRDTAEKHTPVVLRSEMERGIARQRRTHADSLVTVPVTAYFDTAAESLDFESWFFADAAAGAAWFDFTLPRTGTVTQARVVGGDIGQLKPATKNWAFSERTFQLEYIRPNFVQLPPGLHSIDSSRILSVQRNSTATYIDDAGVLQTAAANVARWQGGQLLVEEESTNRCLQSEALNLSPWSGGTRTIASELWANSSPFWTLSKATTALSEGIRSASAGAAAGETWTMTLALLAGNKSTCTVGMFANIAEGAGGYWGVPADCTKQVLSGPGVFVLYSSAVGSLWHIDNLSATEPTLISITRTIPPGSAVSSLSVQIYPGRASSNVIGDSVKGTRVQLEPVSGPTSYIPTTTAPATRAADIITVAA